MRQIKFGPYLRFERDKRTYGAAFRSRSINDWKQWSKSYIWKTVNEKTYIRSSENITIEYTGLGRYFYDIINENEIILNWIIKNRRATSQLGAFDIGIHYRMGDFGLPDGKSGRGNIRQTTEWYRKALDKAQDYIGSKRSSVVLFTDGDVRELSGKLNVAGLSVDNSGDALSAILRLSKARILITSRSTFSMWAAYLGNMPAIWDEAYLDRIESFPNRPGIDHLI